MSIWDTFFNNPERPFYWGWLAVYLTGLILAFVFLTVKNRSAFNWSQLLNFIIPKEVLKNPTCKDDLKIFLIYISTIFFFLQFRVIIQFQLAGALFEGTASLAAKGFHFPLGWTLPWPITALLFAMAFDFGNFLSHVLMHRHRILWQFHKIHHSSTALNPFTQIRRHPFEFIFIEIVIGSVAGLFAFFLLLLGLISPEQLNFKNIWLFSLSFLFFVNFRHSHFWISFGPVLSYVFSSPAMHQIHHSNEKRHLHKNMGFIFSLWDWMFGTIYIPKEKESFTMGLPTKEDQARHIGIKNLFLQPFYSSFGSRKEPGPEQAP